ncbi:MAG: hypothetical protein WA821_01750 [Anaerolineales bacterium]
MKQQPTEPPQAFSKLRHNLLPVTLAILLLCLVCLSLGVFLRSAQQLARMPNPFVHTATRTFSPPTRTPPPTAPYYLPLHPISTFRPLPTYHFDDREFVTQCFNIFIRGAISTHCDSYMRPRATSRAPAATPTVTSTPTPTATPSPTLTPTLPSTSTPTRTATPTFFESPVTLAGASLSSLCCFSVLLIGLLVWLARRWSKKRS